MLVNSCCYNESTIAYIDGLNNRNLFLTIQQVVKFKVKEYTKSVPDEGPLPGLKALVLCPPVLEREREISVGKSMRWQQSLLPRSVMPSHPMLSCPLTLHSCVTAEITYRTAHARHEVIAWSQAALCGSPV